MNLGIRLLLANLKQKKIWFQNDLAFRKTMN